MFAATLLLSMISYVIVHTFANDCVDHTTVFNVVIVPVLLTFLKVNVGITFEHEAYPDTQDIFIVVCILANLEMINASYADLSRIYLD